MDTSSNMVAALVELLVCLLCLVAAERARGSLRWLNAGMAAVMFVLFTINATVLIWAKVLNAQ